MDLMPKRVETPPLSEGVSEVRESICYVSVFLTFCTIFHLLHSPFTQFSDLVFCSIFACLGYSIYVFMDGLFSTEFLAQHCIYALYHFQDSYN